MSDAAAPDYPTFDRAEERFRTFARDQGRDRAIVYLSQRHLIRISGHWFVRRVDRERSRSEARRAYDAAVSQGLGVALTGHFILGGAICVHVSGPVDEDGASRLMYPNGLNLSLLCDLRRAVEVGPVRWAILCGRRLTQRDPIAREPRCSSERAVLPALAADGVYVIL